MKEQNTYIISLKHGSREVEAKGIRWREKAAERERVEDESISVGNDVPDSTFNPNI